MKIKETISTVKITEASPNFVKTIKTLPWKLFFWEATIITNELFHTHIESNGIINENEIYEMAKNCSEELMDNENDKVLFNLYFIKE